MIITLEFNRVKSEDKIIETIRITPKNSLLVDRSRSLYYCIWYLSHIKSIGKFYNLLERKENIDNIINIYEYSPGKPVPKLNEKHYFKYIPVLGKKKCTKCIHYWHYNEEKQFCKVRGKRLNGDYWHKCGWWFEKRRNHLTHHAQSIEE